MPSLVATQGREAGSLGSVSDLQLAEAAVQWIVFVRLAPPAGLFQQEIGPSACPAEREETLQFLLDRCRLPSVVVRLVDQVVLAALHYEAGQQAVRSDHRPPFLLTQVTEERRP
ncbi:hypothetical protein IN07_01280 [Modestobacter caceresii]|uniref:Uncharacterized protein n=1 Tax=Modestobacter caceresii TaxID=1522368 RepID=A0A098YDV5_9ACTN|nr:hypothetical protein IN07_01280 [Modestobacter caceresii]